MPLPKTILVPTNFSEPSEAALDRAIDYALTFGAEVVLLHAYELPIVGFPERARLHRRAEHADPPRARRPRCREPGAQHPLRQAPRSIIRADRHLATFPALGTSEQGTGSSMIQAGRLGSVTSGDCTGLVLVYFRYLFELKDNYRELFGRTSASQRTSRSRAQPERPGRPCWARPHDRAEARGRPHRSTDVDPRRAPARPRARADARPRKPLTRRQRVPAVGRSHRGAAGRGRCAGVHRRCPRAHATDEEEQTGGTPGKPRARRRQRRSLRSRQNGESVSDDDRDPLLAPLSARAER